MIVSNQSTTEITAQELAQGLEGGARTKAKSSRSRTRAKKDSSTLVKAEENSIEVPAGDTGDTVDRSNGSEGGALTTTEPGSQTLAHPSGGGNRHRKKVREVKPIQVDQAPARTNAQEANAEVKAAAGNLAQASIAAFHAEYNRQFQEGMQGIITNAVPQSLMGAADVFNQLADSLYADYLLEDGEDDGAE